MIELLAVVMLSAAPLFSPSIQLPRSSFQNETAEDSQIDREEWCYSIGDMTLAEVEAQAMFQLITFSNNLAYPNLHRLTSV